MKVVALTGGIGCGKSTVAQMFRALGATVIDADRLAREVVAKGQPALRALEQAFGRGILREDGTLDRPGLGRQVFRDEAARKKLEEIVHPKVQALFETRRLEAEAQGATLVVYDVPLLFETGRQTRFETVLVVYVDPATQRQRVMTRGGLSLDEAESRIRAQMPLEDKAARADIVIDNEGSLDQTRAQVEKVYAHLTSS